MCAFIKELKKIKAHLISTSNIRKRNAFFAVAMIMMLTVSTAFLYIPKASAAGVTVPTTAFCYAVPDPVGVDQLLLITYRIDKLSPTAQGTSGGDHFGGFTVTITDPTGTVTTETGL